MRPFSDEERVELQRAVATTAPLSDEQWRWRRRSRSLTALGQSAFMALLAGSVSYFLMSEPMAWPPLWAVYGSIVVTVVVAGLTAVNSARLLRTAREEDERDSNSNRHQHEHWQAVLNKGTVVTQTFMPARIAEVEPSWKGMPTYYFADLETQGMLCPTLENGRPATSFEVSRDPLSNAPVLRVLGEPMEPSLHLHWGEFDHPPSTQRGDPLAIPAWPEHGCIYPVRFQDLKSLLVFLEKGD